LLHNYEVYLCDLFSGKLLICRYCST